MATKVAADSLVKNVSVESTQYGNKVRPTPGAKLIPLSKFAEQQKKEAVKYVPVEDRGQFQYKDSTSGNIVPTADLQNQLKAKESTVNITQTMHGQPIGVSSYIVPAELKIKRNWSVKGPGGIGIPSMNVNEATSFARSDQSARKPNVRVVNGQIVFG